MSKRDKKATHKIAKRADLALESITIRRIANGYIIQEDREIDPDGDDTSCVDLEWFAPTGDDVSDQIKRILRFEEQAE